MVDYQLNLAAFRKMMQKKKGAILSNCHHLNFDWKTQILYLIILVHFIYDQIIKGLFIL